MYRPLYIPPSAPAPAAWAPLPPGAPAYPARRCLARGLRRASAWMAWLARQLAAPAAVAAAPAPLPQIEFCAEAGAPEGALFVDGEYIGRIDVGRL